MLRSRNCRDGSSLKRSFAAAIVAITVSVTPGFARSQPAPAEQNADSRQARKILVLVREAMAKYHLRAVIVRVTIDGQDIVTSAMGQSQTGRPATTDMHFRNGAVAISYIATLMLLLVDQHIVTLDAPIAKWLPELPDADRVTLGMLANMTAGYPDYVQNKQFLDAVYANPHRQWTPQELIDIGLSTPRIFAPGTNWDYSHTDYVILGRALERITGGPMAMIMRDNILDPLALANTDSISTPAIPKPALHAFTSERRQFLGINPSSPFYEESTYWDPSWTIAEGAIQTTNIYDMAATAIAIGTGSLLSPASHAAQVAPGLLGFGHVEDGCPHCHTLDEAFNYGLGVVMMGPWILQNPLFFGYGAVEAYLPSQKIAVAVAVTFGEASFDDKGDYKYGNAAQQVFSDIADSLAPGSLPSRKK
jgi:CubicO group peptidase (beta-lactamase class C family)